MDRTGHFEQFPDAAKLVNAFNSEQANMIATIAVVFGILPKGTDQNHASKLIVHAEKKPQNVVAVNNSLG